MIVIPFAGRKHPRVDQSAPETAEWADVSGDPHDYWRVLSDVWNQCIQTGEDAIIIEHDVVCHDDVIEQFANCPEPWCTFQASTLCHSECIEAWANQLLCTRFRNSLIRERPNALSSLPDELRDWHNLCDHLAGNKINGVPCAQMSLGLRTNFTHHWHFPPVEHIDRNADPDFWYGPGGRYATER